MSSTSPNLRSSDVVDRPRLGLATLIVALGTGSVVYRVLVHHHLEQTAALFIGGLSCAHVQTPANKQQLLDVDTAFARDVAHRGVDAWVEVLQSTES